MHTNTGIIGTMGTGKTQFTKSLITQLSKESKNNVTGEPIGILIFDYKGDYISSEFIEATGAKIYKLFHLPYNPLAIDIGTNSMPLLPLHIASTLQETISNAFGLGAKQKSFLKEIIMNAYVDKGIYKADESTWSNVAPTISDICELYLDDEKMAIDSLHAALKQLYDFEIFQPDGNKTKTLFELIDGVTVINLSGYSPDIQNLVVAITLDAFYSQMQKNGHSKIDGNYRQLSKIVLVDEADNFLSKNFSSIRKILKEGREFGVGTILSTQFLNHFSTSDNEYDQYILTWIIHRVNDVKVKDVDSLFSITDKEQKEQLVQIIKKLEKHHSVVNLAGSKPILIEDLAFWKLIN
jgi:DNA phosphorothioation-dependent restriction protein DptH